MFTDPRYPWLKFAPARIGAKKKDSDYANRIVSDDSQIDIFNVSNREYDLESIRSRLHSVEPFEKWLEGVICFDIETLSLDPFDENAEIIAIGLRNKGKTYIGCNPNKSEKDLLKWFVEMLRRLIEQGCHTLWSYNGYNFDIYYLLGRICRNNFISSLQIELVGDYRKGLLKDNFPVQLNNARKDNKAYKGHRWKITFNNKVLEHIDLYPQVLIYDGVHHILERHSLKDAAIGFGLRAERRLEIGGDMNPMWSLIKDGCEETLAKLKLYLQQDLEDTDLVGKFLLPQVYFLQQYLNWGMEKITNTGTGSWWNSYICSLYGIDKKDAPEPDEKLRYEGALTFYIAGVYKWCAKFDYGSLYPTVMLLFNICSRKDSKGLMLNALALQRAFRFVFKNIGKGNFSKAEKLANEFNFDFNDFNKTSIEDSKNIEQSAKKGLNSSYGVMGVTGLAYNDMFAAAAITSYSRACARFMIRFMADYGIFVNSLDTDGVCVNIENWNNIREEFRNSNPDFDGSKHEHHKAYFTWVSERLTKAMPTSGGITLEAEYEDDFVLLFTPLTKETKKNWSLQDKLNSCGCYDDEEEYMQGKSKNYIMVLEDKEGNLKAKGKGVYVKRGKSWLQAQFPKELCLMLARGENAEDFYKKIRSEILSGSLENEKLVETITVATTHVNKLRNGLPLGKNTIIMVDNAVKMVRKTNNVPVESLDLTQRYSREFYLNRIDDIARDFGFDIPEETLESDVKQLCLV